MYILSLIRNSEHRGTRWSNDVKWPMNQDGLSPAEFKLPKSSRTHSNISVNKHEQLHCL